jgi:hypothetical protein
MPIPTIKSGQPEAQNRLITLAKIMAIFAKASFLADKYAAFVRLSLLFLNLTKR